ncbi:MAG: CMP-N-acetylneuraminic acid synthetase [Clostridium sp.]|jgi:CMP-N-acetylneuraminic acid synthetase|nr:CMP-N-acetylneuraminic acid synthetase [Clostridium sp.]
MEVVAFVPIKLNNERLPGKNLKEFPDGTPLVRVILDTLCALSEEKVIDRIYVYCSDPKIKAYLPERVSYLERPRYLDEPQTRGREIYREFVKAVPADVYVLAHATSPFVSKGHIRECIGQVTGGTYDSAFCARKLQTFLWQGGKPVNFELGHPPRTQDMEPVYMELSTPYVFTREVFGCCQARTGKHPYLCECGEMECIDIDDPEDFELAEAVYSYMQKRRTDSGSS